MWRWARRSQIRKRTSGKFVGVESDHESAERLKDNLTNFLPNVSIQVIEDDVQSWKGPDNRVDLVLMFNFLYGFNRNQRQDLLFGKLQEQWLTKGGLVAVVHASQTECPGTAYLYIYEVWEMLGIQLPRWEDIEICWKLGSANSMRIKYGR